MDKVQHKLKMIACIFREYNEHNIIPAIIEMNSRVFIASFGRSYAEQCTHNDIMWIQIDNIDLLLLIREWFIRWCEIVYLF